MFDPDDMTEFFAADAFGSGIMWRPVDGAESEIMAIVSLAADNVDFSGNVVLSTSREVRVLAAACPGIARGDRLVIAGAEYGVSTPPMADADGLTLTMTVTPC